MDKSTVNKSAAGSLPLPGSKRGIKGFVAEVGRELKKVSWPKRSETNRLTGVVLAVCLLATGLLYVLQFGFGIVLKTLVEGF